MLLPRFTKTTEAVNRIKKRKDFPGERIMLLKLCLMIIGNQLAKYTGNVMKLA